MKSKITNSKKMLAFLIFSLLSISMTFAQTVVLPPSETDCSASNFTVNEAIFTGGDSCNSCATATEITRTLTLSFNNNTGSTRGAVAYWGKIEIFSGEDGTLLSSEIRNECNGPIASGPHSLNFGDITYHCGDIVKITDIWLAWTTPSKSCPVNPNIIHPACGKISSITVNGGVNAEFVLGQSQCGSASGSIDLIPAGGTAPYTYFWTASNGGVVPSGQQSNQNLTGLLPGDYSVEITDANGCKITKTRTITPTVAPVATFNTISDISIDCDDYTINPLVTVELNYNNGGSGACLISGTISNYTLGTITLTSGGGFTVPQTWTFTDYLGRTITRTRTITVYPPTLPILTAPDNITVTCGNIPAPSTLPFTNGSVGGCALTGTSNQSTFSSTSGACGGTVIETWTAQDIFGRNLVPVSRTITISPPTLPTIPANGILTVACASDISMPTPPSLNDSCGNPITPTYIGVSTTPTCEGNVVYTWRYTVCGISNDWTYTYSIERNDFTVPANGSSTVACAADIAMPTPPAVSDNCGNAITPTFVGVSTTPACEGDVVYTWKYTDCEGNNHDWTYTYSIERNDFTVPANGSSTVACAADIAMPTPPAVSDNCGNILMPSAPVIGEVFDECNGTKTYTYTFSDCEGNTHDWVYTYSIIDTTAPSWTTNPNDLNKTLECSDIDGLSSAQALVPMATDNCNGIVTYIKTAGVFVASQNCENAGTYTNIWIAKDTCDNQTVDPLIQTITILDTTAPTFISPNNTTVTIGNNCDSDVAPSITGSVNNPLDNCDTNPNVSYEDMDCFGYFNETSISAGQDNYFYFDVSGLDNLTAKDIEKVSLAFETNQGKGNVEFTLVSPNGTAIVLVGPYCDGGNCDVVSNPELYLPEFYPNSSGYTQWNSNNIIVNGVSVSLTPNGNLNATNTINGVTSYVSSFENLTDSMNGTWFIYARKQGTQLGNINFKSVCLKPKNISCPNNKIVNRIWTVKDACGNYTSKSQTINIVDITPPTISCPIDVVVPTDDGNCTASNVELRVPTIADNCSGITVTNNAPSVFPIGATIIKWTVADACGLTSTCEQTVTVNDQEAPKINAIPEDLTVDCADEVPSFNYDDVIATDNCIGALTVTHTDLFTPGSCANKYVISRTYTVADIKGNSSSLTQIITVDDQIAPTFLSLPAPTSISYTSTPIFQEAVAIDNCGAVTPTFIDVATTPNCDGSYSVTRNWTAIDVCQNVGSASQTINVMAAELVANDDIGNPVNGYIGGPAISNILANDTLDGQPINSSQVNISFISSTISGISLSGTEVVIAPGTPLGSYTLVYQICGVSATCSCDTATVTVSVTATVIDANDDTASPINGHNGGTAFTNILLNDTLNGAPVMSSEVNTNFVSSSHPNITLSGLSNSGTDVMVAPGTPAGNYTLTYQICEILNPTNCDTATVFVTVDAVTLRATPDSYSVGCVSGGGLIGDILSNDSLNELNLTKDDITLSITNPISNSNISIDENGIVSLTGAGICGDYSLIYTICEKLNPINCISSTVDISIHDDTSPTIICPEAVFISTNADCTAIDVPLGAPITADNCKVFSVSNNAPAAFPLGTTNVLWVVTDICGNSATCTQLVTVTDTEVPTITCNDSIEVNAEAGTCTYPSILLTAPSASDNCSVVNIVASPEVLVLGVNAVTWTVTDGSGNTATCTQSVTVIDNQIPSITCNDSIEVNAEAGTCTYASILLTAPSASDNCSVVNIVASPEVLVLGVNAVTWTVTDGSGNTATCTQSVTVIDNQMPSITCNESIEVNAEAGTCTYPSILLTAPSASDNCSVVNIVASPEVLVLGVNAVTWTVTDGSGNTATCTQSVTVIDNQMPSITCNDSIEVNAEAGTCTYPSILLTAPSTFDNCSVVNIVASPEVLMLGVNAVTWTVTDGSGNTATCTQSVTVIDNQMPSITCNDSIEVDSILGTCVYPSSLLTVPVTSDNCGITSVTASPLNLVVGLNQVIWIVTDVSGNTATCTQTVTVNDISKPIIATLPDITTVFCPAEPVFAQAIATDICGKSVSLTYLDEVKKGDCPGDYSVIRTWTATNTNGLSVTASQTINVSDNSAPKIAGVFQNIIEANCSEIPPIPQLQFSDDCSGLAQIIPPSTTEEIINETVDSYTILRNWTVSDLCGNAQVYTQTINVKIKDALSVQSIEACNADPAEIDLQALIPQEYQGLSGKWKDIDNSGGLLSEQNGTFSAFKILLGQYLLEYVIEDANCPRINQVSVNVTDDCVVLGCGELIVHDFFSPNEDGYNDFFKIENITDPCYESNSVKIFNRWGALVYETEGYDNNVNVFRGISEANVTVDQNSELPSGTYYYLLEYILEDKPYKKGGYLYLSR